MAILKYLLPVLSLPVLTACFEDFTPETDTGPVLCINSLITAGEPIEVEVSHTWMYNDGIGEGNHEVKDAAVTVFANGVAVSGGYIPQEGDVIRIVAENHRYGQATAEVCVPYAPAYGKISVVPSVTSIWTGDGGMTDYEMSAGH